MTVEKIGTGTQRERDAAINASKLAFIAASLSRCDKR